jgi:hypothetical protein
MVSYTFNKYETIIRSVTTFKVSLPIWYAHHQKGARIPAGSLDHEAIFEEIACCLPQYTSFPFLIQKLKFLVEQTIIQS